MLFLNVTFYQFALCNAEFTTYRTYWHGESIEMIFKHNNWTAGGSLNNNKEWEIYEESLVYTDIVVCLPGWRKYRPCSNARNVTLARLLSEHKNMSKIITFVCGYQAPESLDEYSTSYHFCFGEGAEAEQDDDPYCMGEQEKTYKERLISLNRYTDKFQNIFDRADGSWGKIATDQQAADIVKYFLTVEIQRLLQEKKCYGGKIDGNYCFRTKEGLRKFQMLNLLSADGIPNRETWNLLRQET